MILSARIVGGSEIGLGPPHALVPWWSFGKTVLAIAALRLVEQGKLALDEQLEGKPYTLRHLLAHRAGLTDYGRLSDYHAAVARGETPWGVGELLRRANANRLLSEPGRAWSYSNIGYYFVRSEIERASDSELGSALHAIVFAPLGIHAFLTRECDDMQRLAFANPGFYDPNWVYHGLIVGTALDAARLLYRVFTSDFLSTDSRSAMLQGSAPLAALPSRPFITPTPGTGLMVDPDGPLGMWFGHSGSGPGSVCAVYYFPDLSPARSVAAFAEGNDEGVVEEVVLESAAA